MEPKIDSRDTLISLLKEKYEHEYNRKNYFDDVLGIPITLSTFLVGGIYFVITDSSFQKNNNTNVVSSILIATLCVTCIVTFYYLYKVYFTFNKLYSSFPDSEAVCNHFADLKNHFISCGKQKGSQELEHCINSEMKDVIIKWYTCANSNNLGRNEERGQDFINAKKWLGVSLLIGIIIFLLICFNKTSLTSEQKPQRPVPVAPPVRQDKGAQPSPNPKPANPKK